MRQPRGITRVIGLAAAACAFAWMFPTGGASAAWPPALTDDLTNPANWPNDPDYAGRWNYWSFLPKQDVGTAPYINADVLLGASGMSIDKAWALLATQGWKGHIGAPDVRIAIIDSGYEWDNADTVNKVLLNKGELVGAAMPQDASGQPCTGLGGYDCNGDGVFNIADYAADPRMTPIVTGDKCFLNMDPTTPSTTDRTAGDLNHNCILDAGDLIERFSDGKDDDGNGYTDDIAGWDFFKNDNNPYDDTRYGHGTGESNDSSAEGNNTINGIGACPSCMFIPLRAGESFVTDANNFAKAVVYATDNGVKIVQEALGTVNQTAFSRAAIDYAYAHGVLIDASMADENSRHHNLPATWNHTLPVHTVRFNNDNFHDSTTFVAFDSCTNYGGHAALSVSGTSCASEATGRTAGVAGLVFSMGLSLPQPLSLSAEEVMQTLKQSADIINVPESRTVIDPATGLGEFYESLPYWSQRFNYGRINAFKALTMVQQGKIPPEVDVTSPTWYQPIYALRTNGPVPIIGTVAAKRAKSYDYVVEWAPGVEPADSDFQPLIAEVTNVPSSTISGGPNAPLATFDPRTMSTAHKADPDSQPLCDGTTKCWGPNDKTITLRVRATAHYGSFDQTGDARRTIAIINDENGEDPDLMPGFPLDLGTSGDGSPKLADIDGDGIRDIVFGATDGNLHVYSMRTGVPAEVTGFPVRTALIDGLNPAITNPNVPSYLKGTAYQKGPGSIDPDIAHEVLESAPAIGDINGDGKPDIVVSTWDGTLYAFDHTGALLPGWPVRLPLVPSCPLDPSKPKPPGDCMDLTHAVARGVYAAPVLVDMNKDGKLDVVQSAFDAYVYIYNGDGTPMPGWPVRATTSRASKLDRIMATPTVTDLNGDGIPDIVTSSNETVGGGDAAGPVFAIDGRGTLTPSPLSTDGPYLKNWPFIRASFKLFPVVGTGIPPSQFAADFDGDGVEEIGVMGNGSPPIVVKADPGVQVGFNDPPNQVPANHKDPNDPTGNTITPGFDPTSLFGKYNRALIKSDTMFPVLSQPAVGDLDQDGVPDPVMTGGSLSLIGSLAGGGIPRQVQFLVSAWSGATGAMLDGMPTPVEDFQFLVMPSIADINGDDYPEVILGTGVYFIHAIDACGHEPDNWPKFTNGWTTGAAAVGDVNGDGSLDVVATTREGYLFAWHTKGTTNGVVQWESFHHDNQNTGSLGHTLDQGVYKRATKPPNCTPPVVPTPPAYDASGCTCDLARTSGGSGVAGLAVLGLGLLVVRRRKR